MRRRIGFVLTWKRIALAGIGAIAAAFAVSLSGLFPIAASSGHFPPVAWFLHFTMQNAVARQSLGISPPETIDLSDPALVRRAAGHFATGCAPCHGAPGLPQSPVVRSMTPAPPPLSGRVGEWKDRELFWIVKNGIKFSGMPAWPTQHRPDEVWALVAFLRALPQMDEAEYRALALESEPAGPARQPWGDPHGRPRADFETALADCARCHGEDGLGRGEGTFPIIAGQPVAYLYESLRAFADGIRISGIMQPAAARYEDTTLLDLARHYAAQPASPERDRPAHMAEAGREAWGDGIPPQILPVEARGENRLAPAFAYGHLREGREALLELGQAIAEYGIPARKIPACESCHGADRPARELDAPYLAGQPRWYADTHLRLFKEGERGGTARSHVMTRIADSLTDEQIKAVATWYASRPAGR